MLISKIILACFFVIIDTWQPNFIRVRLRGRNQESDSEILERSDSENFGRYESESDILRLTRNRAVDQWQ